MAWFLIFVSIVLFFIGRYFFNSANSKTLLEATISTSNALEYKVTFDVFQPDLVPNEYIRMILGFVTKMLHIIDPNDPNQVDVKEEILSSIKKISESELTHDSDIAFICDQYISCVTGKPNAKDKKIIATLYFINPMERLVNASIPKTGWYEYQFLHSWIALFQASLPKLNEKQIKHVHQSIKRMAEMYFEENVDFSKREAISHVQNRSFIESVLVKG